MNQPLSEAILRIIDNALAEDIGTGDVTTRATVPARKKGLAIAVAKDRLVMAGGDVFAQTFNRLDRSLKVKVLVPDGKKVRRGEILAEVRGNLASILQAERVALNLLQRMCGIATLTATYVRAVRGTQAAILDTRKTVPGLRVLDKMAVRAGGGRNHRIGLYDAVLIKDNHIEAAGGITAAIRAQRKRLTTDMPIEVETATLAQVGQALEARADIIMLDNMKNREMARAVRLIDGRAVVEASGNVNLKRVAAIAATGVDWISVGELTHSVRAADISLKVEPQR